MGNIKICFKNSISFSLIIIREREQLFQMRKNYMEIGE